MYKNLQVKVKFHNKNKYKFLINQKINKLFKLYKIDDKNHKMSPLVI